MWGLGQRPLLWHTKIGLYEYGEGRYLESYDTTDTRDTMMNRHDEVSLVAAFTREHHQIDEAIEDFLSCAEALPQRAAHLITAMQALRRHIYLEESIVFPHLPTDELMMPLMVMHREHGQLWNQMDRLEHALHQSAVADEDLTSVCQELLALLERHNSKEEPIIYPYMDAALTREEQDRIRDLLADGQLPDGWVCRECQ